MVCGLKHCSGSNISRKQHEMNLIFKLGTLRLNGLHINFNFLWLWFYRALHLRALNQWFSNLFTVCFMRALSVRAYAHSCLYGVVISTYWRRAKPETSSSPEQIWHFWKHFCLLRKLWSSVTHQTVHQTVSNIKTGVLCTLLGWTYYRISTSFTFENIYSWRKAVCPPVKTPRSKSCQLIKKRTAVASWLAR